MRCLLLEDKVIGLLAVLGLLFTSLWTMWTSWSKCTSHMLPLCLFSAEVADIVLRYGFLPTRTHRYRWQWMPFSWRRDFAISIVGPTQ